MRKIILLGGLALIGAVVPAKAQTQAAATNPPPTAVQKIVVTGSLIPTVETVGPSPVAVISAEQIERSGAATVSEVVRRLPQNTASTDDKFQSGFAPGSASVSLRGLGAKSTLVLLNGHRVAPYGFAEGIADAFVDLNTLPLSAVERIEVLKDGASALYGSDAIAGVVNIILKRDYTGTEATVRFGNTTDSDAFEQSYSLITGLKEGKTSALFLVDYFERNAMFLRDRNFSRNADHSAQGGYDFSSGLGPDPAWAFSLDGGPIGALYPSGAAQINPDGTITDDITGNYFNFNPYISAIPETKRYGVMGILEHKLRDWMDVSLDVSLRTAETITYAAPTPITGDLPPDLYGYPHGGIFIVPAANPYNPFGQDVTFRKRFLEAGPRINEITTDALRVMPGAKFHMANDWEAETTFLYNYIKTTDKGRNYLNADAVRAALESTDPATALNVFGPAVPGGNSPALINSLKAITTREGETALYMGDVRANGPLANMAGGQLMLAVGAELRHETFMDTSDPLSAREAIVSQGGTSGKGSRDAGALFAELGIPLVGADNARRGIYGLDVQIAGRLDGYSDFGTSVNPKIGLKYRPIKELVLRGSYGTGFRAPSLQELYLGRSVSYDYVVDNNPASPYFDVPWQYRVVRAGNPNLDPEESRNWSAGLVYEPAFAAGLSVYVDWGRIKQKEAISDFSNDYILDNLPQWIDRDPVSQQIRTITNSWANLGQREIEFLDFGSSYIVPSKFGEFTFTADLSWLYDWKDQVAPGAPLDQYAGTYQYPEWRGSGTISWTKNQLELGLVVNWIGSYDQLYGSDPTAGLPRSQVASWTTFDVQAAYNFPHDLKVAVGCQNLFDKAPPFSDSESEGYDYVTHDPRGQFVYVQVTKKF